MMNRKEMSVILACLILLALIHGGSSSSALQVTVFTDKPKYNIGESIYVYGEVKTDAQPVVNATVALEVRDPTASPVVVRTLTTDALGKYSLSFTLPAEALLGTYTVNVSCSHGGETSTNTASFNLEKLSVFVVSINVGRSAYRFEEPIEIYGDATHGGIPVDKALVAVEVQDPKSTPILLRVIETSTNGLYNLAFQLPTGSPTGNYTVYASASHENQRATANTTFEVKQTFGSADINQDGKVNILDLALVALAWGSSPGHPRWDPRCDLDGNGIINIIDLTLVAREYTLL